MRKLSFKVLTIFLCLLLSLWMSPKNTFAAIPSTPTGLTATAIGSNQINLTWNYASGATSYSIYRATSYNGSYLYIGSESSLGYIDANLSSNTTYYYQVRAINSDGSSAYSSISSATTNSSSLNDLTATAAGSGQIYLSWPSVNGTNYYYISRSTSYYGTYSNIAATSSTTYTDTGLSSGTTYYYKVQGINNTGSTIYYSSIVNATVDSSPSNDLTATASGSTQIYLSWPAISGTSYYIISRSTSYSGTYSNLTTTSATGYTDTGLSPGTTYYYKVQAVGSSGSTIYYSSIANATANSSSSNDLSATASGSTQIYLSWPAISGTSYYIISRSTSYSGTYSNLTTTSATAYTDTGLSSGTTYYYKVQAVSSSGSTIYYSSIASATANSSSSANLSATATGSAQIYLSWPFVSETSYYTISRSTSYSGTYYNIATTSFTGYTDSGLSSGTTYYYKVQAVNRSGSTIYYSPIASATTTSGATGQITTDRLAGDNRYQTSQEISQSGWSSSYYAIIVSGENYPDALCSAPLASKYNAPILLTSRDSLDTKTRDELSRLNVKSVFLIGGTGVISSNTEQTVRNMGISVTRIAGSDRYGTSLKIAQTIGESGQAVIANGDNYADALSMAPIAAIKGIPILLTPKNSLSGSLKQYLQNSVQNTYVVGGTSAVSNSVLSQLPSPERISGTNRYQTNINIIKKFSSQLDLNTCYLATGQSFPDALTGSALASLKKSPIVLVNNALDQSTLTFIQERTGTINKVIVFGGTAVVPNSVLTNISGTNISGTLSTPSNLVATCQNSNQIYLTWNSVGAATNYYIYRSTSYSGTYSYLTSVSSPGYTDYNLSANITYYYKVAAVNSSGQSAYSPIASATTSYSGYPSTPTGLSATSLGSNQIYLSWNSATSATTYYIYRATSYSGTYSYVTSTSSTSYTDSGLSTYTTYYYKIMAVNSTGSSSYSTIVSATTSSYGLPSTPTGLSASPQNSSEIYLSWSSASSATHYNIYRSTDYSGSYSSVTTVTSTGYTDTGLAANTTYYYKILAYNSVGSSSYSSVVSGATALPAPGSLTATAAGANQINLSWPAVTGATSYIVSRSSSSTGTYSSIATVTANSYSNTGLTAGTTYYYKVQAVKNAVSSSPSPAASATTGAAATIPSVPADFAARAADEAIQINLSWSAVSGATSYTVSRSTAENGTYTSISATITTNSYADSTGLAPNTTYYYKVKANNDAGSSPDSSPAHALTAPSAPANFAAAATGTSITLTWDASPGAATYNILSSATADGTYSYLANVTSLTYTHSGLTAGTTSYYKVQAVNGSGTKSAASASAGATAVPPAPTGLTATASTTSTAEIGLTWNPAAGAASYKIYRATSPSTTYELIKDNFMGTAYTDSGLAAGTTYSYKVQAFNPAGSSPDSAEAAATTKTI